MNAAITITVKALGQFVGWIFVAFLAVCAAILAVGSVASIAYLLARGAGALL